MNVPEGHRPPDPDWGAGYYVETAPQEAVDFVLAHSRSQWVWIRLPDGDLVLATFPQGDDYFATEEWRKI